MPKKKNSNEKKKKLYFIESIATKRKLRRERETQISNISQRISIFKVKDLLLG